MTGVQINSVIINHRRGVSSELMFDNRIAGVDCCIKLVVVTLVKNFSFTLAFAGG
jgi:hypothetical protein